MLRERLVRGAGGRRREAPAQDSPRSRTGFSGAPSSRSREGMACPRGLRGRSSWGVARVPRGCSPVAPPGVLRTRGTHRGAPGLAPPTRGTHTSQYGCPHAVSLLATIPWARVASQSADPSPLFPDQVPQPSTSGREAREPKSSPLSDLALESDHLLSEYEGPTIPVVSRPATHGHDEGGEQQENGVPEYGRRIVARPREAKGYGADATGLPYGYRSVLGPDGIRARRSSGRCQRTTPGRPTVPPPPPAGLGQHVQ